MHLVIAQATEAVDAVKGLGKQLPALGIGVLAMGGLVWIFVGHLASAAVEARKERQERDAAFTATIRDVSRRGEAQAERCHQVQAEAVSTIRENSEGIGSVRSALERPMTVTQDLSQVLAAARAENQARR